MTFFAFFSLFTFFTLRPDTVTHATLSLLVLFVLSPFFLPPPSSTFLHLPPCTVDAVPDTLRGMCGGRGEPGERGPTRLCNGEGEGGSGVGAAGTKMVI